MRTKLVFCLILAFLFGITIVAKAQFKGIASSEEADPFAATQVNSAASTTMTNLLGTAQFPVGNSIDPDYYLVGPGDILSIQMPPIIPMEVPLKVTPDYTIVVPRIGELKVKHLTLTGLRDTLNYIAKLRNDKVIATVSLMQPRMCLVTLSGNVITTGSMALPSTYRVSSVIKYANQLKLSESFSVLETELYLKLKGNIRQKEKQALQSGIAQDPDYASRNIIVLHKNGESQIADIEKAIALKDPSYDPYITEGDEIIVPFDKKDFAMISISGAVKKPKTIAYKKGDKASELLKMGFGFTENVDLENIYLYEPTSPDKIKLIVDTTLRMEQDYTLAPGSSIVVGTTQEKSDHQGGVVSISGQVKNPGVYLIKNKKTRIKDAIDMAGGFTDKAYLPLSYINRKEPELAYFFEPKKELWETFQYSDLTMEDTVRYAMDMMLKKSRVSCDFVKAFEGNSDMDNVVLHDGDMITIPENPDRVYVYGQVNFPGFVDFQKDKPMQWYIHQAGGYANGAAEERARIIRGNNKVWLEGDEKTVVYSGDEIYVPRPPDVPTSLQMQKWGTIAGIVGTAASVLSILFSIYINSKNN